ncbi:MAG: LysM domain-containing protein [Candidatus Pacearchaeota archaeon]
MKKGSDYLKFISLFQIILMISLTFSFSFILSSTFVGAAESIAPTQTAQGSYTVEFGDTLSEIAARYSTTPNTILALNSFLISEDRPSCFDSLQGVDCIFPGDKLTIPISTTTQDSQATEERVGNFITKLTGKAEDLGITPTPTTNPVSFDCKGDICQIPGSELSYDLGNSTGPEGEGFCGGAAGTGFSNCSFFGIEGGWGYFAATAVYAYAIYTGIQWVGSALGIDDSTTDAIANGATAAYLVTQIARVLAQESLLGSTVGAWAASFLAIPGIGWIVFAVVAVLSFKKEKEQTVTFTCLPWQAESGGDNCKLCNNQDVPCSEYQCRSLGKGCELVNKGTSAQMCDYIYDGDVIPPEIEPLESALLDGYIYTPDGAVSPPDRGVKIINQNSPENCAPAYTPLSFGIQTNEPAACKIDVLRKSNFEDMRAFLSAGLLRYNHTYSFSLPSPEALAAENITLENGGDFQIYMRCEDANGNSNPANFQFRYCVEEGPDTTPPFIVTTSIIDGSPIAHQQKSADILLYVNEPAECKWDHQDRSYDLMSNSLSCQTEVASFNSQAVYTCDTTLDGLKDEFSNEFYFRCKDKPGFPENERNTNEESHKLTLMGTRPLLISSASPNNEVVSDSANAVSVQLEVETSQGFKDGEALCKFSDTGNSDDYLQFFETNSHLHSQELSLAEGSYNYFIMCNDLGGNTDNVEINFEVETDTDSPSVVRVYKEDNFLKIITDEESFCVYVEEIGCSYPFKEGTSLTTTNNFNHFLRWNPSGSDLYIKCEDSFGNQPAPNQCNIVVKASQF